MSIKFPDMQVLLSRTDQLPKIQREGEPHGAGKMAPQVSDEFKKRQQQVTHSTKGSELQRQDKEEKRRRGSRKSGNRGRDGGEFHLDVRV